LAKIIDASARFSERRRAREAEAVIDLGNRLTGLALTYWRQHDVTTRELGLAAVAMLQNLAVALPPSLDRPREPEGAA